mgnify:CR=1 FL=1
MEFFKKIINELRNTGERPQIETMFEEIQPVLQFAYKFAKGKIRNKSILDYGCGGGYGTEYLSRFTNKSVIGFDIDKKTINVNKDFYSSIDNLIFTDNLNNLSSYDVVVSLQVIEHLNRKDMETYLFNIKKYLKENGIFILATVNKNVTSYKLKKPIMPFHIHEFYPTELAKELKKYFRRVKVYGQMTENVMKKTVSGKHCYNKNYDREVKLKILRFISQIGIIRRIVRHIPLFIKSFILGYKSNLREKYILVNDENLIDNSYVLICECN